MSQTSEKTRVNMFFVLIALISAPIFAQDYYDDYYYNDYYGDYYDNDYYAEYTAEEPAVVQETVTPEGERINIRVPLFQDYRSPLSIANPANPSLPANNTIARLKGTVWRADKPVLRTNSRNVVSQERVFLFFQTNRDAIAYVYAPAQTHTAPIWPQSGEFFPLIPLVATNVYSPVPRAVLPAPEDVTITNIQYIFEPLELTNYNIEEVWIDLIDDAVYAPSNYQTVHTNTDVVTNIERSGYYITTNQIMTITTNITQYNLDEVIGERSMAVTNITPVTNSFLDVDVNNTNFDPYAPFSLDELPGLEGRRIPPLNGVSELSQGLKNAVLNFVAQEIGRSEFYKNLGGDTGGIFLYETGDIDNPFKIIFLRLDNGQDLYEYSIDTNIEVRAATEAADRARELYIRILTEKINMKLYKQVRAPRPVSR